MIQRRELLLSNIVDQLRAGTPVVFSRWGDGEWAAMLGTSGANCDGHAYTPELQRDLTAVLESRPSYYLGLQAAAVRRFGPQIEAWLVARSLTPAWVPSDLWHHASIRDELGDFLAVLRDRGVILVGPRHLNQPDRLPFPLVTFVEVPERNCHEHVQVTAGDLAFVSGDEFPTPYPVIAVSASMSANVIIHHVQAVHPHATLLDLGSLWEPYVGVATRTYHKKIIERLQGAGS